VTWRLAMSLWLRFGKLTVFIERKDNLSLFFSLDKWNIKIHVGMQTISHSGPFVNYVIEKITKLLYNFHNACVVYKVVYRPKGVGRPCVCTISDINEKTCLLYSIRNDANGMQRQPHQLLKCI
jgi:hypothetical protein